MGQNCCKGDSSSDGGSTQVALQKGHERQDSRRITHHGVMTKMALKFPRIRRSFKTCETVFKRHAGDKDYVPKSSVKAILVDLGANEEELTEEVIDSLVATANLDGDDKIDFKEFLIAAAVGVFLKVSEEDAKLRSEEFQRIRDGFDVVQQTFAAIDKDGSGEIDYEELKNAFMAMRSDELIENRLKELDINGDKTIEFPEFIFGMCAWVGMEDDDTEDEDYSVLSPQPNSTMSFKKDFPVQELVEEVTAEAGDQQSLVSAPRTEVDSDDTTS